MAFVFYRSRATVFLKQNDNYKKKHHLNFYGKFSNEKENGNAAIVCLKSTGLPFSMILSVMAIAVLVAHDGKLAAKSLQSDRFKSKLSNVEKLLRDDSQLKF